MTYEYVCTACQHEWEASQSISEAPLKECPKCHAQSAKRQVSGGSGFVLKGGGWYSDLYSSAKPKAAPAEGGSSEAKPPESKPAEAKSESKATEPSKPSGSSSSTSGAAAS